MRYLILSDIHANWEALDAALAAAEGRYEKVLCLGDTVGYGADPNAAVEWVRANVSPAIRGNHDRACSDGTGLDWFSEAAEASARWTRTALTAENTSWLRGLPQGPIDVDGFQIAHGSPLDEDEYIVDVWDAALLGGQLESSLCFFGHTHLQGGFSLYGGRVEQIPGVDAEEDSSEWRVPTDGFYLVNPGSIGQPRDRDPRAAFALYDSEAGLVTFRRTTYAVEQAQRKIRDAGLPEMLASRLALGQ